LEEKRGSVAASRASPIPAIAKEEDEEDGGEEVAWICCDEPRVAIPSTVATKTAARGRGCKIMEGKGKQRC
jgi:hypothetical protein